jgi:hypothetical protein
MGVRFMAPNSTPNRPLTRRGEGGGDFVRPAVRPSRSVDDRASFLPGRCRGTLAFSGTSVFPFAAGSRDRLPRWSRVRRRSRHNTQDFPIGEATTHIDDQLRALTG